MHWGKLYKLNNRWMQLTIEAIGSKIRNKSFKKCRIIYTRGYWCHPGDFDGVGASVKPILDSLVKLEIIPDDNPKVIAELVLRQKKFKKKELQTTIEIIDLCQDQQD